MSNCILLLCVGRRPPPPPPSVQRPAVTVRRRLQTNIVCFLSWFFSIRNYHINHSNKKTINFFLDSICCGSVLCLIYLSDVFCECDPSQKIYLIQPGLFCRINYTNEDHNSSLSNFISLGFLQFRVIPLFSPAHTPEMAFPK